MKRVIEFKGVSLGYGSKVVLEDISMCVEKGERLGVIGPNGSGKTTFLKGLLGLLNPLSGEIVREKGMTVGYVKQDHSIETLFPFTAFEVAFMGLEPLPAFFRKNAETVRKTGEALEFTRMIEHKDELFRTLSGGQKQRVLIARALAGGPSVLVLDEPISDLDAEGVSEIMQLLNSIHSEKKMTIVIVSHLLDITLDNIDRVLLVNGRRPSLYGSSDEYRAELVLKIREGSQDVASR